MSRNMLVLFLLVAVICATVMSNPPPHHNPPHHPPMKCGKNEVFNKCGSACPPTCKNLKPKCHHKCVHGCFCKPGLVKNANGQCVRPCECDC